MSLSEHALLQMVSQADTGRYASDDIGPQGRWDCEISRDLRGERNISYKGVKTSL